MHGGDHGERRRRRLGDERRADHRAVDRASWRAIGLRRSAARSSTGASSDSSTATRSTTSTTAERDRDARRRRRRPACASSADSRSSTTSTPMSASSARWRWPRSSCRQWTKPAPYAVLSRTSTGGCCASGVIAKAATSSTSAAASRRHRSTSQKRGNRVTGIESSAGGRARSRERARRGDHRRPTCRDRRTLGGRTFDVIIFADVLEHLAWPVGVLKQLPR